MQQSNTCKYTCRNFSGSWNFYLINTTVHQLKKHNVRDAKEKQSCRFLKIKSFYKTVGPISGGKDENSNTHSHQTDKVDV